MTRVGEAPRPGEFELIAEVFAPLARNCPGALGLTDDAALLAPSPGHEVVLTIDTLVGGRHFPDGELGRDTARRLLRVNLSDLAAMGARPLGYLLAISLPDALSMDWIRDFADGLAADQVEFGISLIGGDTTSTGGPLTATVTALGETPQGRALRRSTAKPGDRVFVSGTIGDAALGLLAFQGRLPGAGEVDRDALIARYRLPLPRTGLGQALLGVASACADVSDGLAADLGHICETSRVRGEIGADSIPLSDATRRAVERDPALWSVVLSGGDDYELVFTAPPEAADAVRRASVETAVPVTEIGRVVVGKGVGITGVSGGTMDLKQAGYRHF